MVHTEIIFTRFYINLQTFSDSNIIFFFFSEDSPGGHEIWQKHALSNRAGQLRTCPCQLWPLQQNTTDWRFKQQTFISSCTGGWKSEVQVIPFLVKALSLACRWHLLTVSSQILRPFSSYKDTILSQDLHCDELVES